MFSSESVELSDKQKKDLEQIMKYNDIFQIGFDQVPYFPFNQDEGNIFTSDSCDADYF